MDVPYGLWDSPISADMASSAIVGFQDVVLDGDTLYWSEMRPNEGGRYVIVKASKEGDISDILPSPFNARTRVHEYGGAAFTLHQGELYFTNFRDQRVYKMAPNEKPSPLTQTGSRFADFQSTPFGLVAVGETHQGKKTDNFLALINTSTGEITTLTSGYDFYSSPTVSENGKKIAWICWNHPNMPWDDTQLWVADFVEGKLVNPQQVDKQHSAQAFFQPMWRDSTLIVSSDKSNWWNLYEVNNNALSSLFSVDSEIGEPLWNFGASSFGFFQEGLVCTFFKDNKNQLFFYKEGKLTPYTLPYSRFAQIRTSDSCMGMIAGAPDKPSAIIKIHPDKTLQVIRQSTDLALDQADISVPQHITYASKDNRTSYAYFYPPKNKRFQGIPGTLPPLIVKSHGGPTANSGSSLNLGIQYWTSRGFAVVDVNYAGSTGYGRAYRKSLEGNWGIYDVEDCEAAALYLADKGLVDKHKLAIMGGSAGGYTTLAALTFTDTFAVGASHYGVSDLEALAQETHKFESKYLDRLLGPYPEAKQIFHDRSPIHHLESLSSPIIFFQGDEDEIVPPAQAKLMVDALKNKGIKTEYWLFEGEQHGFRKSENRIKALEAQRSFFIDALSLKRQD